MVCKCCDSRNLDEEIKMQITPGYTNAKAYHKAFCKPYPDVLSGSLNSKTHNTTLGHTRHQIHLERSRKADTAALQESLQKRGSLDSHPTLDEGSDARKPDPRRADLRALVLRVMSHGNQLSHKSSTGMGCWVTTSMCPVIRGTVLRVASSHSDTYSSYSPVAFYHAEDTVPY